MDPLVGVDEALDEGDESAGNAYPDQEAPVTEDGVQGLPEVHPEIVDAPDAMVTLDWQLAGEALAAVTGLFPKGPITRMQGAKAEALLSDIGSAAEKFSKFGEFAAFKLRKRPDFEAVYEKLLPLTEDEVDAVAGELAEPELIDAWQNAVNAGRAAVRAAWPVQIRDTPTGPDWVEPGRLEGGRAADVLAAVNSPLEMLEDLQRGSITPAQVTAVELAAPELLARIRESYSTACRQREGKRCPWDHEGQLRVLFGAPSQLLSFGTGDASGPKTTGKAEIQIDFDDVRTKNQTIR